MTTFATSYNCGGHSYASYVRASRLEIAKKRIRLRGLNERIDRRSPGDKQQRYSAYDLFVRGKFTECLHWLCFTGNALCNAGLWKRENLLSDAGLIHRVIHSRSYSKKIRKQHAKWIAWEEKVTLRMLQEFDKQTAKLGY